MISNCQTEKARNEFVFKTSRTISRMEKFKNFWRKNRAQKKQSKSRGKYLHKIFWRETFLQG